MPNITEAAHLLAANTRSHFMLGSAYFFAKQFLLDLPAAGELRACCNRGARNLTIGHRAPLIAVLRRIHLCDIVVAIRGASKLRAAAHSSVTSICSTPALVAAAWRITTTLWTSAGHDRIQSAAHARLACPAERWRHLVPRQRMATMMRCCVLHYRPASSFLPTSPTRSWNC